MQGQFGHRNYLIYIRSRCNIVKLFYGLEIWQLLGVEFWKHMSKLVTNLLISCVICITEQDKAGRRNQSGKEFNSDDSSILIDSLLQRQKNSQYKIMNVSDLFARELTEVS